MNAGTPTPETGQHRQRGEGIAIVLTAEAVAAWKANLAIPQVEEERS